MHKSLSTKRMAFKKKKIDQHDKIYVNMRRDGSWDAPHLDLAGSTSAELLAMCRGLNEHQYVYVNHWPYPIAQEWEDAQNELKEKIHEIE